MITGPVRDFDLHSEWARRLLGAVSKGRHDVSQIKQDVLGPCIKAETH